MSDRDVIESKLGLLAAVRRSIADHNGPAPDVAPLDELLDERGE